MSEVDLAKIFRHMLLGVSHTHVPNSELKAQPQNPWPWAVVVRPTTYRSAGRQFGVSFLSHFFFRILDGFGIFFAFELAAPKGVGIVHRDIKPHSESEKPLLVLIKG